MGGIVHLARRFFGSLSPKGLDPADDDWVRTILGSGERDLWDRMPLADRTHAAGVAREVARLRPDAERPVLAAALLHDVGKIESGLGTFGRVFATVVAGVAGRRRARTWEEGPLAAIGAYVRHPAIGAELLRSAGADPLTVRWAAEHHLPADRWTLPTDVATVLAEADDD